MHKRQNARNEKENTVHDPERKAGLEHRALLIGTKMQPVYIGAAENAEVDLVGVPRCHAGAVFACDAAQLVDACDERGDEAEVDEGYEEGVVFRTVVGEEGADCPGGGEDGHDEEDEDVVGCQGVVASVDVDEVGQHAEGGDLERRVVSWFFLMRLGRRELQYAGLARRATK